MLRAALLASLALLLAPTGAGAFVVQERGGLASFTNGIALGPDGNFWVTESGNGTVARLTPGGRVLQRIPVGAAPTSVAVGGGGRVWVAGTGSDQLARIDALSPAPTATFVSTAGESDCGPVGIVSGGNGRMYFSLPARDCAGASRVGSVADDGTGMTSVAGVGTAFDLEVSGGKLFVPDFDGTSVRRLSLTTLAAESLVTVGSLPDGIAADGAGGIWVTLFTAGDNLARFPAAQDGGAALPVPTGIVNPFGIVLGPDGRMYIAGSESAEIARVEPSSGAISRYGIPGAKPWQLVVGPDEDLWASDLANPRVLRYVNSAPRATSGEMRALATTAGTAGAKVDPRGNATEVVFDYGTTTAYGRTTAPITVPAGAGEVDVRADLPKLKAGTTYHVRVRAANAEGSDSGADATLTTPRRKPRKLPAAVAFRWRFNATVTQLTRVLVRDLRRTETIRFSCRGGGCAGKDRKVRARRKQVDLTRYVRGRDLRKGARLTIRITAPNAIGIHIRLTVRAGRDPKVQRRCLAPGKRRPSRC